MFEINIVKCYVLRYNTHKQVRKKYKKENFNDIDNTFIRWLSRL